VVQTQVCVRAADPADANAMRDFLTSLSTDTQYQRFFTGLGSVSPSLVRDLLTVTPRQQVMLAVCGSEVVGHGMAVLNKTGAVELGLVVSDGHRRQGVATRLARMLIENAVLAGAEALQLDVLCENRLVVDWIRRSLPDTRFERDGHTLAGFAPLTVVAAAAVPAA
jgi:ribosomal protein S18 acetylase RimI-like enzyme